MSEKLYKDIDGKPKLSLVPQNIITGIAEVREYGNKKYPDGGIDNWKKVPWEQYLDAALRHMSKVVKYGLFSKDEESGIEHLKHAACNLAFLLEVERTAILYAGDEEYMHTYGYSDSKY